MKIVILNRLMAEKVDGDLDAPHAIISITDPREEDANVGNHPQCKGVLFLKFRDFDLERMSPWTKADLERIYPDEAMTELQAEEVVRFVRDMQDSIKALVIHCDAGVSRSAGMGAALAKCINGDDQWVFDSPLYLPNMYVYRLVFNAWWYNKA